ncbi:MAG: IPT/TIG domain-containing protein [Thermovenabulum sp.]|uniref:IPT/TIG domain-containing protein n=1 Tax=Thermovenabulum sp. TaxID=3100335 RepID=UPI003C7E8DEF
MVFKFAKKLLYKFLSVILLFSIIFTCFTVKTIFAAVPVIKSISPSSGSAAGGETVNIYGENFTSANNIKVLFGSAEAKVISVNTEGTLITVETPSYPQLGKVSVTVKNSDTEIAISDPASGGGFEYLQSKPQIDSVSPLTGTAGTEITITGKEFMKDIDSQRKLIVQIGGYVASKITYVSSTVIKAVVPAMFIGYKDIRVENPDGGTAIYYPAEDSKKFYYQKSTPTVTSITPAKGPINTATEITIKGTNFVAGYYPGTQTPITTVTVGGVSATDVQVINETTIIAKTPPLSTLGPQHVIVTVDGVSAIKENGFTYISKPEISAVNPNKGSVLGGTQISITGSGFMNGATVKFGSNAAKNVVVQSSTLITATLPESTASGLVSVTVTNPDGGSYTKDNAFEYTRTTPVIDKVSNTMDFTGPAEGSVLGNEWIYIKGKGFGDDGYPDEVKVYFGSKTALEVRLTKTSEGDYIAALTPQSSVEGTITLKVVNKDGGTATSSFTYTRSKPVITDIFPTSSTTTKQEDVTITGYDFMDGAKVYFGSYEAKNVVVSTDKKSIKATIPESPSPGLVDVKVVNPDQGTAVSSQKFEYVKSNPEVTSVVYDKDVGQYVYAPINADIESLMNIKVNVGTTKGGNNVRIEGKDFSSNATVTVGGKAALNVKVTKESPERHIITFETPLGDVGVKDVVVQNPDGSKVTVPFKYVISPTITGITPSTGTTEGGDIVEISGTNFAGKAEDIKVFFGGAEAQIQSASSTKIVVKTPRNQEGAKNVTVINLTDYGIDIKKDGFTYVLPPSNPQIESISPLSGPTTGGTEITVVGYDIRSGAKLYIGGNEATVTSIEVKEEMLEGGVVYKTTLKAVTPPGTAGEKEVKVINSDGKYALSPKPFTYKIPEKALSITSITPNKGSVLGGTSVTVKGANFVKRELVEGTIYRKTKLTIGGNEAYNVDVKDDLITITAQTPGGSLGAQDVIVKVVKVDESKNPEEELEIESSAVLKGGFTYELPKSQPKITKVVAYNPRTGQEEPAVGPVGGGTIVRIYGEEFIAESGGKRLEVYFGKNKANIVEVVSSGLIQAITPSSTQVGAVDVKVVNPDGGEAVAYGGFIYKGNNIIVTGITPNSASVLGGVNAIVFGANFIEGTQVTIGGEAALNVVVESPTKISLTVPPNTPGLKDVVVYNSFGSASLQKAFLYYVEQTKPIIDKVEPNIGKSTGGDLIKIYGQDFMAGPNTKVFIGENQAQQVNVKSTTEIEVITPPGTPGWRSITIINSDGGTYTLLSCFKYISTPVIDSVTPSKGPVEGGMYLEIKGKNFMPGLSARFVGGFVYEGQNYIDLQNIQVISESLIKAFTPPSPGGYKGFVDIEIINPDAEGTFGRAKKEGAYLYKDTYTKPEIYYITPNKGPVDGGTEVTITGKDFAKDAAVVFGDSFSPSVVYRNSTTLIAKTPPGKEGTVDVQVINLSDGGFAKKEKGFTYTVPRSSPKITSVVPNKGSSEGGTPVTIYGSDFREGIIVLIDGKEIPNDKVNLISPTELRIKTPVADTYGKKAVTVVNQDGGMFTLKDGFEYVPPATLPVITNVTPTQSTVFGGALVRVFGKNFVPGAKIYFGGVEAQEVAVDETGELATCVTPAYKTGSADVLINGKYPVEVILVNPDGGLALYQENFYFVVPESRPKILEINPSKGPKTGGNLITIEGVDFRKDAKVFIGTKEAKVEKIEDDQGRLSTDEGFVSGVKITVEVPTGDTGKVDVRVLNPDGGLALLSKGYEYLNISGEITLEFINPSEGAVSGGTPFVIKGKGFVNPVSVYFGGELAKNASAVDPNTIKGYTPPNTPGKKDVVVLNGNGLSGALKDGFEYKVPSKYPKITGIDPNKGPSYGGIEVNIYGENFLSNAKVYIGENEAQVTLVEPNHIRIILPPGDLGVKDVIVINPDTGIDILEEGFSYVDFPKIEKIEPNEGPVEGGTEITITGKNFKSGLVVLIGEKTALNVNVASDTKITAKTPPHTAGYKDVKVINPDGAEATLKDGFYYKPPRTKPETPMNFIAVGYDKSTVKLSWDPSLNANYYEIYGAESSNSQYKYIGKTADTVFFVTGLSPDTKYYFKVRAANELGVSDFSYADYAYTLKGELENLLELPYDFSEDKGRAEVTVFVKTEKYLKDKDYKVVVKSNGALNYKSCNAILPVNVLSKVGSVTLVFDEVAIRLNSNSIYSYKLANLSEKEKEDTSLLVKITRPEGKERDAAVKNLPKGAVMLSDVINLDFEYKVTKYYLKPDYINAYLYIDYDYNTFYQKGLKSAELMRYDDKSRAWSKVSQVEGYYFTTGGLITNRGYFTVVGK